MPQMAPLMWLTLFILFSSLMFLSMIKIYFSKMKMRNQLVNSQSPNKSTISSNFLNWKW